MRSYEHLTEEEKRAVRDAYADAAREKGFLLVSATPLTRSSYHAAEDFQRLRAAREARLAAAG